LKQGFGKFFNENGGRHQGFWWDGRMEGSGESRCGYDVFGAIGEAIEEILGAYLEEQLFLSKLVVMNKGNEMEFDSDILDVERRDLTLAHG
jgi:hypothetical protein